MAGIPPCLVWWRWGEWPSKVHTATPHSSQWAPGLLWMTAHAALPMQFAAEMEYMDYTTGSIGTTIPESFDYSDEEVGGERNTHTHSAHTRTKH